MVAESSNKYPHAHIKVVQNYGDFIEYLDKNLTPEKREEFNRLKTTITSTEDQNEFFKNLVLLNNLSDIPTNFDKLKNPVSIKKKIEQFITSTKNIFEITYDVHELIVYNLSDDEKKELKILIIESEYEKKFNFTYKCIWTSC